MAGNCGRLLTKNPKQRCVRLYIQVAPPSAPTLQITLGRGRYIAKNAETARHCAWQDRQPYMSEKGLDSVSAEKPLHPIPAAEHADLTVKSTWSVPDLLRIPESSSAWIVNGLLKRGSQMLLAAPPKSGKSLLASELALSLSLPFKPNERRFLFDARPHPETKFDGLEITRPPKGKCWRVLFVSLEMREAEVSIRLRQQLRRFGLAAPRLAVDQNIPKKLVFPLTHVFGLPDSRANEVLQDLQWWRQK